jgi:hypothetical protein
MLFNEMVSVYFDHQKEKNAIGEGGILFLAVKTGTGKSV